jgi:predicted NUDIX family NTP pyrophosphohydrolase
MYRVRESALEFLLVHPGGPFWKNKDAGTWTIPKGEVQPGEELLAAARREFEEELGLKAEGSFDELKPVTQKGGKVVHAWAFTGDCDPENCRSNMFRMEWPPKSGKQVEFPEVDQVAWFGMEEARVKVNPAQVAFLEEVQSSVKGTSNQ